MPSGGTPAVPAPAPSSSPGPGPSADATPDPIAGFTPDPAGTDAQSGPPINPTYKGKTVSTDPAQMRALLNAIAAQGSLSAAETFATELANPPANNREPFVA
jgi:hypothetical protein